MNQGITAVGQATDETGTIAHHFQAEAELNGSRYLFRVEFNSPAGHDTRRAVLKALDHHRQSVTMEYKTKRESQRLRIPVLHVTKEGWYERHRKPHVESGKRAFQAETEVPSLKKQPTAAVFPDLDEVVEIEESRVGEQSGRLDGR